MKAFILICFLFCPVTQPLLQAKPAGVREDGNSLIQQDSPVSISKLPTATIKGDQDICEGDSAQLTISLTGRHPWDVIISDGTDIIKFTKIESSPFTFWVSPESTTTYTILSVLDSRGTLNKGKGTATVVVNQKTDVEITGLELSYDVEAEPVILAAVPAGGTFFGPGVTGPPWLFDPSLAGTANSPHKIYYSYTNENECTSEDSAVIYVLTARGELNIPKEQYCNTNKPFSITASNTAGITGSFTLLNATGKPVDGLVDNHDNTAVADPGVLSQGTYTVLYRYVQISTTLSLRKSFNVEVAALPRITKPSQSMFCQNTPAMELISDIPEAVFTGPGVSGDINKGFVFNPAVASPGENFLLCTYTTEHGCVSSVTKTISINYVPEIRFTTDKTCVGKGDTVRFTNATNNSNITSWDWNFGDPQSGSFNHSSLESPAHVFSSAGTTTIILTATTEDGCIATSGKDVSFTPRPSGSFRAENDCFSEGKPTLFTSEMKPASSISNYKWTFYLPGDLTETVTGGPEVSYLLDSTGEYKVELYAESDPGCSASVLKTIYLKPTLVVSDMNYLANFEEGNGSWVPEGEIPGDNPAWRLGNPGIERPRGDTSSAWYAPGNSIRAGEQSYLSSPCFNLKNLDRPMIELDVFRNLEKDHDGVVLQASADNGPWTNVGEVGDGINWYNSDHIGSQPGGQATGWAGGDSSGTDTAWVTARHDLNDIAGDRQVRFRLSYARDTTGPTGHTAFALGRVVIRNRTQNVLLEHFTNGSDDNCRTVNARVNSIFNDNYRDLVKLEYHTDFPGYDPFFELNPAVPATRTLYYGITTVPYSVLDGGPDEGLRFDYANTGELSDRDVVLESLADPGFDIRLMVSREQEKVTADVTVTALGDIPANERILQVAVFEKRITKVSTGNGETSFLNVVKALLPNAAGTAIFESWTKGESRHYIFSWNFENVYDPQMIRVAAFLQNDNSRQVYQAATNDTTNISTGRTHYDTGRQGMTVYPNPTEEGRVNISLKEAAMADYHVEIIDQTGRLVKSAEWHRGEISQTIELPGLSAGIYTVVVKGKSGSLLDYRKLIIIR